MTTTQEHAVDFLGHQMTGLQDDDGTVYVPLRKLCEILGIDPDTGIRDPERVPPQKLLTAEDVGRILGIGARTVNKLAKEGKMGCVQLTSRKIGFTKELVEEFIDAETYHRDPTWDEARACWESMKS